LQVSCIVWKAVHRQKNEVVEVKKLLDVFQNAPDAQRICHELCLMKELGPHENILEVKEVLKSDNGRDFFVIREHVGMRYAFFHLLRRLVI
jgi:mitogen-activated protein kinase 15